MWLNLSYDIDFIDYIIYCLPSWLYQLYSSYRTNVYIYVYILWSLHLLVSQKNAIKLSTSV